MWGQRWSGRHRKMEPALREWSDRTVENKIKWWSKRREGRHQVKTTRDKQTQYHVFVVCVSQRVHVLFELAAGFSANSARLKTYQTAHLHLLSVKVNAETRLFVGLHGMSQSAAEHRLDCDSPSIMI